jgi:hypothetical protein
VRALSGAAVALCLAAGGAAEPAAAQEAPANAAEQLIETYAPVLQLRKLDDDVCENSREQYQPMPVGVMLGNPKVELQLRQGGRTETVTKGPSAQDIAGLGEDYYLNIPGDPLRAGCTYARDWQAIERGGAAPPVTYAHIAREEGEEGLVVQYWFFWYFNQFNDQHEGDWEGMQIAFEEASTPAEALEEGAERIAVFQHAGGQLADWGSDEVEKRDETHPIVYPAAGSHATFFEPAIFVENGQGGAGLGCDNTTEPHRELTPQPVRIPTDPPAGSKDVWLTYEGHWGQREPGSNTGPRGPNTKRQWTKPFTWMDGLRPASPQLPGGNLLGPAVTSAFCGTVAFASKLLIIENRSSLELVAMLAGAALLILLIVFSTRWRPVELEPLRRRRRIGQIIRGARQLYGRDWMVLLPLGLLALAVIGGVEMVGWIVAKLAGEEEVGGFIGPAGGSAPARDIVTSVGRPIGFAIVGGAVVGHWALRERGAEDGIEASARLALSRIWRLVLGHLTVVVLTLAMALTVIGIPFAVWKYVHWQFVQQQILFEDASIREALRGSTETVKGRWFWTAAAALFFWLIGVVIGPVLGFGLIFANFSLTMIDMVGSLVFALLVPYIATGRTLIWFSLKAPAVTDRR